MWRVGDAQILVLVVSLHTSTRGSSERICLWIQVGHYYWGTNGASAELFKDVRIDTSPARKSSEENLGDVVRDIVAGAP